jgi:hypothetical protein
MAAPLELPDAYRTTAMLEAAIDEAHDAVDAATDHQTLRALFDNILTTLADPDAHREVVSGILAGFRDGASLGALKRAVKQFLNRLVPATGGTKKSGFIKLMIARHFLKRKGKSYDPPRRQKQMPDGFDITLMKNPSVPLRNMFETFGKPATKKTLLERIKSGEVSVEKKPSKPPKAKAEEPPMTYKEKEKKREREEREQRRAARRAKALALLRDELSGEYKLKRDELEDLFDEMGAFDIPIPPQLKRRYDNYVKRGEARAAARAQGKGMTGGTDDTDEDEAVEVGGAKIGFDLGRALARLKEPVETFHDVREEGKKRRGEILERRIKGLESELRGDFFDPRTVMRDVEEARHAKRMAVSRAAADKRGRGMTGGRYKLRKAPGRPLFWVVGEDGKHHSKEPLPKERAEAQMRALYRAMDDEEA